MVDAQAEWVDLGLSVDFEVIEARCFMEACEGPREGVVVKWRRSGRGFEIFNKFNI